MCIRLHAGCGKTCCDSCHIGFCDTAVDNAVALNLIGAAASHEVGIKPYYFVIFVQESFNGLSDNAFELTRIFFSVIYDFHMPGEDFIVYVDRYGLSEGSNEQGKSVFKAEANFDSKGTYISAAQYVGGQYDSCYVDIILKINGHNYNITKNKKLYGQQLYMELPTTVTTTRSTTLRSTAEKAAKKTKKSTTTKKKSTGSAISKSKAAARAKISTTKFKPNYNITTAAKQQKTKTSKNAAVKSTAAVNNSDASEEAQISQESAEGGDKFEINPQAKQFFPLLLIIVIIGVAALCIGAAKNKKEKKDGKEEENKEENDE